MQSRPSTWRMENRFQATWVFFFLVIRSLHLIHVALILSVPRCRCLRCFWFFILFQKRLVESESSLKTTTVIPKEGSNKTTIHTKVSFSLLLWVTEPSSAQQLHRRSPVVINKKINLGNLEIQIFLVMTFCCKMRNHNLIFQLFAVKYWLWKNCNFLAKITLS